MKFPNKTSRLIHQMWDEMVTMIVIKKDNIMEIISKMAQTNVEGSYVITVPKKQKKGGDNGGEKGEDNWQLDHEEISQGLQQDEM